MKEKIITQSLDDIMGDRFGKYSKYIIQDRALPDVRDGLKPVQRRILYAMYKDGNTHLKPYRKSAKTVGNVIGNYHPHGDTSVYEAMVRLSQEWKMRIPLIDMQGNNGSIDNDPAAAMRYTEARLSPIASELLKDIDKETVQMALNFDDTEYEPTVLPAKYPNLLVNGATGISSGYATDIPPHNLEEVIDATIYRILHPHCSLGDLMKFIKGPDFPTGAIVEGINGIRKAFETGKGKVVVRSQTKIVEEKNMNKIVVTEIPYEVNKAELVRKLDEIRFQKNIDGIIEVRDESDRNGLSIVIDLKKDVDVQNTLNYFYKNTDLQKNYNYNMVAIKNKRPVCMGIVEILDGYIDHQIDVVTKRSLFDLKKAQERKHIVDGLIKAISILDDVVHTIRHSHDKQDAKKNLQLEYHFTEKQAEAIVMLQLYRLTNTDIVSLEKEKQELETLIQTLNDILNSDQVLRKVIVDELKQIKKQYPSPRLTQIKHEVQEIVIDEEAMILPEDIYVSITRDGYVKRISQRSYKASENIAFGKKDDDVLLDLHFASTLDKLLIFTDKGNYLFIPIHKLEEFKWKELGKHISYFIKVSPEEKMIGSILVKSFVLPLYVLLTTRSGQIKRVPLKEFEVARYTKPLKCMNLKKDDQLLQVALTDTNQAIVLTSSLGYVSLYSEDEISILGLKAAGIKAMNLKDDYLIAMNTFDPLHSYSYVLISDQPGIKRMRISDIPSCNRATKGTSIFKSPKTNPIHALDAFVLDTQDQLIIESEQKKENLYIKDYSLSQIGQKPSVIQSMKNETIMHVYDRHSLSTDLYISNQDEKVEKSQPLETTSQQDKHFEPISFDDLFKEDF
ncbi:DNA topoisomerase IV subunit A [Massilimicrobiota timonensis]|uniref:DNA topoisomerase IV subunit A n=1 Tax=Massilimicrobiota timonensis TaxID=1776392 RepID=UPI00195F2AB1|nr:DNA topoisomerase IV subunit A [Massilimicrobiota timonensis]MBM6964996.1 DNA topoisomerase IV subunit A [Massilimicrobiota timonensis]